MLKKLTLLCIGLITTTTAFAQLPAAKKAATLILKPRDIMAGVPKGIEQAVTRHVAELRRANVASLREVYQLTNQQIAPTATAGEQVSALLKQMDVYAQMQARTEQTAREILAQYGEENIPREILRQSAQHGLVNIVPYFMKNGANPSDVLAEYLAYPSIVKSALDRGATVKDNAVYMTAVRNGYSETVSLLRKKSNIPYETKIDMFKLALEMKQFEVAKVLLPDLNLNATHPLDPINQQNNLLWENIEADNMETVLFLLENGSDPNFRIQTVRGFEGPIPAATLLLSDKWATYLPILKKYGADLNTNGHEGSLLHEVITNLEKTKFLVELGANPRVTARDVWGNERTPCAAALSAKNVSFLSNYRKEQLQQVINFYRSLHFH
ncbi:hypothetical protein [Candidatus Avelusimicrobium caledoniensis]|uniref:hypothetical protein n=1 Tax=Candidatus Avelusimicrobium caledoniensis TaxID=3416220 RepID=UPI003D0DAF62